MSPVPAPLRLLALCEAGERPVMLAAARQLAAAIGAALGQEWELRLAFAEPVGVPEGASDVVVASLLRDAGSAEPIEAIEARWHAIVAETARRGARIVVPTLYRHVADPAARGLMPRIRRLNALAIALSRAHGVEVADVDRAFASVGAAPLESDYRCAGPRAALAAGHVLAGAILAADLAPGLAPGLQEAARTAHGGFAHFIARNGRLAA